MLEILELANEVIKSIFKHLSAVDLAVAAQVCRSFRGICVIDDLWRRLCLQDFGVNEVGHWPVETFRELYTLVLHKYGCLLGLWSNTTNYYGNLIHIWIDHDGGSIAVDLCRAPKSPNITSPVIRKPLFAVRLQEQNLVVECLKAQKEPHHPEIKIKEKTSPFRAATIEFVCKNINHHDHETITALTEVGSDNAESKPAPYFRLDLPLGVSSPLFKPGIFKGTYSAHGIELIWVRQSSADKITGTKITGDPNVPAGKVTFEVDLTRPAVGSLESVQQNRLCDSQFLKLPPGVSSDYEDYPSTILASFSGKGRIAFTHFRLPQWTPCHFVLFSDNMFGNIWLELGAFGVYSRATENYLQIDNK